MTTVDDYLHLISKASDRFGDKLVQMMDKYNKTRLADITYDEAKEFYEECVEHNDEEHK